MTKQPQLGDAGSIIGTTVISRDYIYTSEIYETVVQYITDPSTSPEVGEEAPQRPNLTIGILLSLMICLIAFGNSLVVLAVLLERRLRTFENFFFASLAVADLSIAVFVLPFVLTVELSGHWQYSYTACDMFIFTDVACCTASILHLCTIGLNRYWSITSPLKYATKQTCRRACIMITCVWLLSFVIACPPLFGWPERRRDDDDEKVQCDYDVDIAYVIYSSCGSFYIPFLVMTIVYIQIFRLSKKGARFRRLSSYQSNGKHAGSAPASPKDKERGANNEEGSLQRQYSHPDGREQQQRKESYYEEESQGKKRAKLVALFCPHRVKKDRGDNKRRQSEAKTAKTLGIIMGAFVFCWLPFFLLYVIKPLCGPKCHVPIEVDRFALWLGYFNSLLNPLIYICCKPLFRVTFKRILTFFYCRKRFESRHLRHEMHYFRGRKNRAHNGVASWGCPVAPDESTLRRHQEHPEDFGNAFSDGYREKRPGGLRQMALKEYAEEFHPAEKCSRCNHDVDPLDSSGANQDIDDYLNYVIANGYLRPDLCKEIGLKELFSPHKCKTPAGNTKYHCRQCCKPSDNVSSLSANASGTSQGQSKSKSKTSSSSNTQGDLNLNCLSCSQARDSTVKKTKSLCELTHHDTLSDQIQPETQSSPSTENTLMNTTCTSPKHDTVLRKAVSYEDKNNQFRMTTSPTSIGLKRDTCPCSHGVDIVRVATTKDCETGL